MLFLTLIAAHCNLGAPFWHNRIYILGPNIRLVPIRRSKSDTCAFPFHKWDLFRKINKTKELPGGVNVVGRANDSAG
jgi:hypothetical protein